MSVTTRTIGYPLIPRPPPAPWPPKCARFSTESGTRTVVQIDLRSPNTEAHATASVAIAAS